MASVSEVLSSLDQAAPAAAAASWDAAGLQLGDPSAHVGSIAVCHEVTEDVIEEVESTQPDLLVTYHPLLFRPTTRLVAGPTAAGRAWRLVRAGVALAVTHTSFDSATGGTADALATALGLVDVVPFGAAGPATSHKVVTFVPGESVAAVRSAMAAAGGGRIGNYTGCSFRSEGVGAFEAEAGATPAVGSSGANEVHEVRLEMLVPQSSLESVVAALVASHPYEEPGYDVYETTSNARFIGRVGRHDGTLDDLVGIVTSRLGGEGLRVTRASSKAHLVAVLPGSGSSFAGSARAAGADVLVTGDVDHHRAIQARDGGMSIIDSGHGPSERPGMAALVEVVRHACPDATLSDLTGHDPTPWR